jgi:hypothetical protein
MSASTGELHTASGEWLSNAFLALANFAGLGPEFLIQPHFEACILKVELAHKVREVTLLHGSLISTAAVYWNIMFGENMTML